MLDNVVILGASTDSSRYAYRAATLLNKCNFNVIAIGKNKAIMDNGIPIVTEYPKNGEIHTLTMYLNPSHQAQYADLILQNKPKRIIFNPGTENDDLIEIATNAGIEVIEACTLVMLLNNTF